MSCEYLWEDVLECVLPRNSSVIPTESDNQIPFVYKTAPSFVVTHSSFFSNNDSPNAYTINELVVAWKSVVNFKRPCATMRTAGVKWTMLKEERNIAGKNLLLITLRNVMGVFEIEEPRTLSVRGEWFSRRDKIRDMLRIKLEQVVGARELNRSIRIDVTDVLTSVIQEEQKGEEKAGRELVRKKVRREFLEVIMKDKFMVRVNAGVKRRREEAKEENEVALVVDAHLAMPVLQACIRVEDMIGYVGRDELTEIAIMLQGARRLHTTLHMTQWYKLLRRNAPLPNSVSQIDAFLDLNIDEDGLRAHALTLQIPIWLLDDEQEDHLRPLIEIKRMRGLILGGAKTTREALDVIERRLHRRPFVSPWTQGRLTL